MPGVLAVVEVKDGQLRRASLEVASEAVRLGASLGMPVTGLVVGVQVEEVAKNLGNYGVENVVVVEDERLANAYLQPYVEATEEVAKQKQSEYLLFPASSRGKAISSLVAARLGTSVVSECTSISPEGDKLVCKRPVYAGKAIMTVSIAQKPGVVSLRPNVVAIEEKAVTANVEKLEVSFSDKAFMTQVVNVEKSKEEKPDLTEAAVIVSGGRGMKKAENFSYVEELADQLGATVGASRAVVDDGWRPHKDQVGQTGKTVSPNLYIACGISGAIQHLAGMRTSKVIVAINKDEEAPIFKVADYGIVGDVFDVLPKMTEEAKKIKEQS